MKYLWLIALVIVLLVIVGCDGLDVSLSQPNSPTFSPEDARNFITLIVVHEEYEQAQTYICLERKSDFKAFFDERVSFVEEYARLGIGEVWCTLTTREDCPSHNRNCLKGRGFICEYWLKEPDYPLFGEMITLVVKDDLICD